MQPPGSRPLGEVLDLLIERYHTPLATTLPALREQIVIVHRTHHERHGAQLHALLEVFLCLQEDLDAHVHKRERMLFPLIRSGAGPQAVAPMMMLEAEQEGLFRQLDDLRTVTDDFTVPEPDCPLCTALWRDLLELETTTRAHLVLSRDVLYPRARRGDPVV